VWVLLIELFFILLVKFNYLIDLVLYEFPSGRWELEISYPFKVAFNTAFFTFFNSIIHLSYIEKILPSLDY
jgi:hypothetical protein